MTWQPTGEVSVGPNDDRIVIGSISLQPSDDTIWIRCRQTTGQSPWPYGFGLLSWQTEHGRELGTSKVYGHSEGETFRLGTGLSPMVRTGLLVLEPRSYNLAWIRASAAVWRLSFEHKTGSAMPNVGGGFTVRFGLTGAGIDRGWTLAIPMALARVVF